MRNQLFSRKAFFSLLAVVMCLGFTAMSYGQAVVSVSPAEVESPAAGENLEISINISGGADVAGYQVTVSFDPTALEYVSSANADYLPAGAFSIPTVTTDSSVTIGATSLAGAAANADGTLAIATFKVVEAKASAIALSGIILSDAAGTALDFTAMDGMVTVPTAADAPADDAAEEDATDDAAEEDATDDAATDDTADDAVEEDATDDAAEEDATDDAATDDTADDAAEEDATDDAAEEDAADDAATDDTADDAVEEDAADDAVEEEAVADDAVEEDAADDAVEEEAVADDAVEEPVVEEPMPEPEPEPVSYGFDVTLAPGLNMMSVPLMPEEPYTAKSLAEMLGATVVIQFDAGTQNFTGYTVADSGDGFGIEGGKGYIVNTPAGASVKFTGSAWDNQPKPEPEPVVEEPVAEEEEVAEEPVADDAVEEVAEEPAADDAVEEVAEEPAADDAAEEVAEESAADDAVEEVAEEPAADDAAEETAADDAAEEVAADDAADDAAVEEVAADDAADDAAVEEVAAEEAADDAAAAPALSNFKSAWAFVVTSDIQGMETGRTYTLVAENRRTGSIATQNTTDVRRSSAVWADLNRKSVIEAGDKLEIALYDDRGRVVSGPFQRTVSTTDIVNAFLSVDLRVGDVRPQETVLAQNFPNPFNPETWIPYQLSKATEVSIDIYDVSGRLVRSLDLGWQSVGSYMTPSSAAYWDGRNAVGERVASGIYFYTLQTSDFAATRRMVILK